MARALYRFVLYTQSPLTGCFSLRLRCSVTHSPGLLCTSRGSRFANSIRGVCARAQTVPRTDPRAQDKTQGQGMVSPCAWNETNCEQPQASMSYYFPPLLLKRSGVWAKPGKLPLYFPSPDNSILSSQKTRLKSPGFKSGLLCQNYSLNPSLTLTAGGVLLVVPTHHAHPACGGAQSPAPSCSRRCCLGGEAPSLLAAPHPGQLHSLGQAGGLTPHLCSSSHRGKSDHELETNPENNLFFLPREQEDCATTGPCYSTCCEVTLKSGELPFWE